MATKIVPYPYPSGKGDVLNSIGNPVHAAYAIVIYSLRLPPQDAFRPTQAYYSAQTDEPPKQGKIFRFSR